MLKCEISNGKGGVNFQGNVLELVADLTVAVNAVYSNLKSGPVPEQAEILRQLLVMHLADPASSAWAANSATKISSAIPIRKEEEG